MSKTESWRRIISLPTLWALKYVLPEERNLQNRSGKTLLPTSVKRAAGFCDEHLLPLLVEAGEQKLAYDVLLQENCPGGCTR